MFDTFSSVFILSSTAKVVILLFLLVFICLVDAQALYTLRRKAAIRDKVQGMFDHAFRSYMDHAFPMDELKPLSCEGSNVFGGYALTAIDSLDTLALMGYTTEFMTLVKFIERNVTFDSSMSVSVFETTIRVIGGMLSGHALAEKISREYFLNLVKRLNFTGVEDDKRKGNDLSPSSSPQTLCSMYSIGTPSSSTSGWGVFSSSTAAVRPCHTDVVVQHLMELPPSQRHHTIQRFLSSFSPSRAEEEHPRQFVNQTEIELFSYTDSLLRQAVIIADKFIPAFDTPTGIPFNEINLKEGVDRGKGQASCPAAAGSLLLEFATLSTLTNNCTYYVVAKRALNGVWKYRSQHHLVGSMMDIFTGKWLNAEANIGASIDSFYEYLFKAYVYLGEKEFLENWVEAYRAIQKYTYFSGWYLTSSVEHRGPLDHTEHKFNSLSAFWPGLQVLAGDVDHALSSFAKLHCVVRDLKAPPEYLHLQSYFNGQPTQNKVPGQGYPLRPEYLESAYFLYLATREEKFLEIAENFLNTLATTRQKCGFAAVLNVHLWQMEDKMDSYVLAETFKYLYLLFSPAPWESQEAHRDPKAYASLPKLMREYLRPPIFDLSRRYVFNTEAHPLEITIASHNIGRVCKGWESEFFLPHNDRSKLRESFNLHGTYDELFRRAPTESKNTNEGKRKARGVPSWKMCKPVDYMVDVAPFLREVFYFDRGNDPCYEPPVLQMLGHRSITWQPRVKFAGGGVYRLKETQSGRRASTLEHASVFISQEKVTIARDRTVPFERNFSFLWHNPTSGLNQPTVSTIFGMARVPSLTSVDSLYLDYHNVLIIAPDPRFKILTAPAGFGPRLCKRNPDLQITLELSVPLFDVSPSTGCSASSPIQIPSILAVSNIPFGILLNRGECSFKEKALHAQQAGASVLVIVDAANVGLTVMGDVDLPDPSPIRIPLFLIQGEDGIDLRRLFSVGDANVAMNNRMSFYCYHRVEDQYRDLGLSVKLINPTEDNEVAIFRTRFEPFLEVLRTGALVQKHLAEFKKLNVMKKTVAAEVPLPTLRSLDTKLFLLIDHIQHPIVIPTLEASPRCDGWNAVMTNEKEKLRSVLLAVFGPDCSPTSHAWLAHHLGTQIYNSHYHKWFGGADRGLKREALRETVTSPLSTMVLAISIFTPIQKEAFFVDGFDQANNQVLSWLDQQPDLVNALGILGYFAGYSEGHQHVEIIVFRSQKEMEMIFVKEPQDLPVGAEIFVAARHMRGLYVQTTFYLMEHLQKGQLSP